MTKTLSSPAAPDASLRDSDRLRREISETTAALQVAREQASAAEALTRQVIDGAPVATFVIDARHIVTHWNKACESVTGIAAADVIGTNGQWRGFYAEPRPVMADLIVSGDLELGLNTYYAGRFSRCQTIDGAYEGLDQFPGSGRWLSFTAAPLRGPGGEIVGTIETLLDVTERRRVEIALREAHDDLERKVAQRTSELAQAYNRLEADMQTSALFEQAIRDRNLELTELNNRLSQAQAQLLQSEKLASIGQLAAGVAHEINNPIGYVHSNLGSLDGYLQDLLCIIGELEKLAGRRRMQGGPDDELIALRKRFDLDYLREDIPALLRESSEGIHRVKKIVQDLKDFSRLDGAQEWAISDLHQGITSTLNIVANEIKYCADVSLEFGVIPEVECLPSQLNQVFMNLLVNAAQAMGDSRGTITVRTGCVDARVWIEVRDTGCGIRDEDLSRVFDPFFTTKLVGKGTGLGLSLSYGIVQKHGGSIELTSEVGVGTLFKIWLPVRRAVRDDPVQGGAA